jgi:hypothetical protein
MNSPAFNKKLSLDSSRPAKLAASDASNEDIVEEAYLLVYSRLPTADEKETAVLLLRERENRRGEVEDLFWALLNTPEFLFVD